MHGTQRGFTYLGALFLIVLMGLALAGTGELWSTSSQRAKERELIWVGTQYARALRSYYQAPAAGVPSYPLELEELLEDHRHPSVRRHLRRLYPDPVTGSADWGLIRGYEDRIVGVYSRSEREPMKTAGFPPRWSSFEGATRYADWKFVAELYFLDGVRPAAGPSDDDRAPVWPPAGRSESADPGPSRLRR